jgi:hypothetical protein
MQGEYKDILSLLSPLVALLSCPKKQQYSETEYENCLLRASYAGDA